LRGCAFLVSSYHVARPPPPSLGLSPALFPLRSAVALAAALSPYVSLSYNGAIINLSMLGLTF
jgi:hypothetical protein